MDDPKQFMRDPATGNLVEGRWVCPSCRTVNGGPRCGYPPCEMMRPTATVPVPDTSVVIVGDDDDDGEPDEPTWPLNDPPGGESGT